MLILKLIELARYICVGVGFYLAYQTSMSPGAAIHILVIFITVPMAGLTGIESVFFSAGSAQAKGRELASAYQVQSGMNNLALAITAFIVWYWQWDVHADLSVLLVLLIFFCLSSLNHAYEYFFTSNNKLIHLLRPIATLLLVGGCIPLILKVL